MKFLPAFLSLMSPCGAEVTDAAEVGWRNVLGPGPSWLRDRGKLLVWSDELQKDPAWDRWHAWERRWTDAALVRSSFRVRWTEGRR